MQAAGKYLNLFHFYKVIFFLQLHEECDSFGTNVVRTTTLIERLRLLVTDNPSVDKALLSELSRLLDPTGDDGYLKKEEFVKIGIKVSAGTVFRLEEGVIFSPSYYKLHLTIYIYTFETFSVD